MQLIVSYSNVLVLSFEATSVCYAWDLAELDVGGLRTLWRTYGGLVISDYLK